MNLESVLQEEKEKNCPKDETNATIVDSTMIELQPHPIL